MKKITYIFILISFLIKAGNPPAIIFKENKGQWPEKVLFGAEFLNTKFYINKNSLSYCVYKYEDLAKLNEYTHHRNEEPKEARIVRGHNYEVNFVVADLTNVTKTIEQQEYYNYILGNKKSKWASNIKAYGNLLFNEAYEGIDLKLYSNSANLKYDFVVKPNGNVNSIKLYYKYINSIEIENNELHIKTSVGEIIEKEPISYQMINGIKKSIKCKYTLLSDNTIGFTFPEEYNKNYELVIDPTVVVCSYSSAFMQSDASACTFDDNGNIYSFGYADLSYPTTTGAFQTNYNAHYDYALSVYNTTGSTKLFSTYLGGDSLDFPLTAVVKNNEITLYGQTLSKDFPHSTTAFDTIYNGSYDLVLSKLNMAGSVLLASTFVGGSGFDGYNNMSVTYDDFGGYGEMVCDTSGNVYVVSATTSTNFPVLASAISTSRKGFCDACVFKLDKTLSNLIWSTYLGGTQDENGRSLRLDGNGGVYLCGITTSTNFPVTSGAIQSTKKGPTVIGDLYISHINSTGTSLIASTYLGTTSFDYARQIDLNANNDVYIFSHLQTPSTFTPAPVSIYSNPNGYNVIYKVNSTLSSVIFKTKFGNYVSSPSGISPYLISTAFKVDSCQNIYIAGFGQNSFFTTPNAFQPTFGGAQNDLYFAVFSTNCSSLKFGSYWGGNNPKSTAFYNYGEHSDGGISHFDNRGYLYMALCSNGGIPTTTGAFNQIKLDDSTFWNDGFIKIDFQTFINAGSSYGANITGCPPFTTQFVSTTNTGSSYWNLGDGTTTNFDTITHTYFNLGTYNVLLVVTDTNTCNRTDSIKSILNVINPTPFSLGDNVVSCIGVKALLKANISAITYSWSTGQTTPNIYAYPGTYTLTINNGGCNSSAEISVVLGEKKLSERFPNVLTPNGDLVNDWIDFKNYNFEEVEFYIYDRWGKEHYKIINPTEKWQPNELKDGTYYYVVNYKSSCTGKHNTDKGFISVFK